MKRLCALVIMALAAPAAAEPDRPWATGVSEADQARAKGLFDRGNTLLDQGVFVQALDLYQQALAVWDHPAIRYNAAVALINLDRPLDAYRELEQALRFGASALDPDVYPQALSYQRLLRSQIVRVTIECVDAQTRITLDNASVATTCPGASTTIVLPGRHRIVATKPGSLGRTIDLALSAGESPHERIDLMTIEEATVTHRRWAPYKPWLAVAGAGVLAGVGLGFELQAAAWFRSYDKAIVRLCPDSPCTSVPLAVSDAYDAGRRDNRVALGLFIGAGAAAVTGAVLVYLNRPVHERLSYPAVSLTGTGVAARWAF